MGWAQRVNVFCFCRLYPSPSRHLGSVWFLPVISLLLTNTASRVGACLSIWLERLRGKQKEDERGPYSINFSIVEPMAKDRKNIMVFITLSCLSNLGSESADLLINLKLQDDLSSQLGCFPRIFQAKYFNGDCQVPARLFCSFHQILSPGFFRWKTVFHLEITTMLIYLRVNNFSCV